MPKKPLKNRPIRLATWNINSLRLRIDIVLKVLKEHDIDVLCVQETKVMDELFPMLALHGAGYTHTVFSGQKSYNGVAIISRIPLEGVKIEDLIKNGEKRHISAFLPNGTELHNFYVPAGGDIPDPAVNRKFDDKLKFVDAMHGNFGKRKKTEKLILVGDLNIAPLEHDVWSHKQLLDVVSHTPIEVEKLTRLQQGLGWVDALREFHPHHTKLYSWWSYRNQDWKKSDRGRRLDHIWLSQPLHKSLISGYIMRDARDWPQPSDHVPVIIEIAP